MAAGLGIGWGINWGSIALSAKAVLDYLTFKLNFNTIATDFTFTRNSFATRVNEFGLIETVTNLSSNLVQNGDFEELGTEQVSNGNFALGSERVINGNFDDGENDWSFSGDWTLVNGTAEILTSTQSYLRSDNNRVPYTVKTYKLQYEVVTTNGSNMRVAGGSSAFGTVTLDSATVGVKTVYLTSNGTQAYLQFNQNSFRGSIDNISLKEVTDWDLASNWSVENNEAIADATQGSLIQTGTPPLGTSGTYKFEWTQEITSGTRFRIFPRNGNDTGQSGVTIVSGSATDGGSFFPNGNCVGSGTYTVYIETTDGFSVKFLSESGNEGKITNVSVKQVDPNDYWDEIGGVVVEQGRAYSTNGSSSTSGDRLKQTVLSSGVEYVVTTTIENYVSGTLRVFLNGVEITNISGEGTFVRQGVADGVVFQYIWSGFEGDITNVLVQEVLTDDIPRIDYTGSTFDVPVLGDELVTNGDFDTDISGWTKGGGNTNPISWDNGKMKVTNDVALLNSARQSITTVIGKTYLISADVDSTNGVNPRLATSNPTTAIIGTGGTIETLSYTFVATSTFSEINLYNWQNTLGAYNLWDNVSVKEVTAYTTTDKGAFLLEPISTNLITYSEDFTQWNAINGATVTLNDAISPDGTSNATRLDFNPSNTTSRIEVNMPSGGANDWTFSFWVKSVSGADTSFGAEIGSANAPESQYVATSEWQRFEKKGSTVGAVNIYPQIEAWTTNNDSIYIWGFQMEALSYATSYIPTSGTTVTRAQETCQKANLTTDGFFGDKEGVIFLNTTEVQSRATSLNSFTPFRIYRYTGDKYRFYYDTDASFIGTAIDLSANGGELKMAFSVSSTEITLYVNGSLHAVHTIVNAMASDLQIWNWVTENKYMERVKDFRIYDKPLTDEQLIELTTI